MESVLLSRIFRQLFAHETCSALRYTRRRPNRGGKIPPTARQNDNFVQKRTIFGFGSPAPESSRYSAPAKQKLVAEDDWQQRAVLSRLDKKEEFDKAPLVTAEELKKRRERPKHVKMLMRDFFEDCLYNPHYGYFPKEAVIFSPGKPFNFNLMRDEFEFFSELRHRYNAFEDALDEHEENKTRQLWHTPTELFRPYYGEAMARYLVANYKLSLYPYYDLLIYELGAGNGTLMLNILDYIAREHPEVYARTKYRVIEISNSLAKLQTRHLKSTAAARRHSSKVEIINRSIFDWDTYVSSPCFFLTLEVIDNFAHDCLRYDVKRGIPLQGYALIDSKGDFYDFYDHRLDPIATRYLSIRDVACTEPYPHPLGASFSRWGRRRRSSSPASLWAQLKARLTAQSLSEPEYIPTRLMQFFDILHNYFPAHKLLCADFNQLTETVPGINAPVVQTRYERRNIPVTTPMAYQGYFDIFFPTDFAVQSSIYSAITGKFTTVLSQGEFLRRWSYPEDTRTLNGDNPMLSWYQNASVMVTV